MSWLRLEHALLPDGVADDVLLEIEDGIIESVRVEGQNSRQVGVVPALQRQFPRAPGETVTTTPGLTLPGLANCHSHAFHRALRGRTQAERGSFWTWREQMYAVAAELTPDSYFELARETYAEMRATGITAVGEFHYLHHQPDGTPYDDPNEMGRALLAAADEAGIRITLLDTCYLAAGFDRAPEGVQVRYSDGDAHAWAERVAAFDDPRVASAIHSVRAVPPDQLATVVEAAAGRPLHVHLSEQVAENEACLAATGRTPTQLLADAGALGPLTTAVHATHLTDEDVRLLGESHTSVCFCPTTERDLADGIGPSRRLHEAGAVLTLGSDSHAVIDLFEEMRAVEMHERLATQQRGHWSATELIAAATYDGHRSLGLDDAGRIAVGQRADLVTVDLDSVRTHGTGATPETLVFAATGADVLEET
jgi:formiminoglutamate deiminase